MTLFTRLYDPMMKPLEAAGVRAMRRSTLEGVEGRVLDVGCGTGANMPLYAAEETDVEVRGGSVDDVVGIDISAEMLSQAVERADEAGASLALADAQNLPFTDSSFDSVVFGLVLCTTPRPERALAEAKRVLRPGGRIYALEHVRLGGLTGRLQDVLTPGWKRLADGCHLDRETVETIERAGFDVVEMEERFRGLFVSVEAVPR